MNVRALLPEEQEKQSLSSPGDGPVLETSDRKPRLIGLAVLAVAFGVFGLWAAFAPLESAAIAPGVVTVKGNRKTVQHLEGGIVREILVAEGDEVVEGQPLILLDKTQFAAELGVLTGQYYVALAKESRLIAERDGLPEIQFHPDLAVDDPRAQEAMANERGIFNARKAAREGEQEVLQSRIAQLESQIAGLEELIRTQEGLVASYEAEAADLKALLQEGFVEKTRIVELERAAARTRAEIAERRTQIAQAKMQIGETRLQMLQLDKQFRTEVVDELARVQAEVFDLRERLTAIRDRVERTVIRAPATGRVLGLRVHTVGAVIQGGTPLMEIVPEGEELVIEARVKPTDIDSVAAGQPARVRFSAFNRRSTPTVEGVVTKVGADRLVDEKTGTPYYPATIEVSEEGLHTEELAGLTIVPGMPADVLIVTGERTLLQYLLQPARDALALSLKEQ
ncbi:MAG: HlyD family type I secretion periplasmic adaptor subunit [Porticoccaceae bacterium]|nr:MAG: HlyD family type I secretion periplasmic adaptor subunit [Porticoccaceae bacterium]